MKSLVFFCSWVFFVSHAHGNESACSLYEKLKGDQDYFNRLLANWPRDLTPNFPTPVITNSIGLVKAKPKKVVSFRVSNTSWEGPPSDFHVIAAAYDAIDFVSWATFQQKFQASIDEFKATIGQQEYAIFVPSRYGGNKDDKLYVTSPKSNHYFAGKAVIEGGLRPSRVVKSYEELTDISHLVIVDDGSYSGWQLHGTIHDFFQAASHPLRINIHLIVPYVSHAARVRVQLSLPAESQIFWYQQELIRQASEVNWPYASNGNVDMDLHLTIFEHKLPDTISTFPLEVQLEDGQWYSNMPSGSAPTFVPEYKKMSQFIFLEKMMDIINRKNT